MLSSGFTLLTTQVGRGIVEGRIGLEDRRGRLNGQGLEALDRMPRQEMSDGQ
jgi:hypothetical protein